jgi:hypothetical protein
MVPEIQCKGKDCKENMIYLENPLLIMLGADVAFELDDPSELPEEYPHAGLIFLICTSCGNYNIAHLSEEQFQLYNKEKLKIELNEEGEAIFHYLPIPKETT